MFPLASLLTLASETAATTAANSSWLTALFTQADGKMEVAHAVLILALVIASGLVLGSFRVFGISLGIAGVLFTGIAFGHFNLTINHKVLEFVREFGLILFVYTIGLQVGPGFLSSLRKAGLPLNIMAASIVLLGVITTLGVVYTTKAAGKPIEMPVAVGLLSGGTTNTPSLAAAQQAIREVLGSAVPVKTAVVPPPAPTTSDPATADSATAVTPPATPHVRTAQEIDELNKLPGLGYAVAYPFGILGIIITMLLVRVVGRVDVQQENELFAKMNLKGSGIETHNYEVTNPNISGKRIEEIPQLANSGIVISRVLHNGKPAVASQDFVLSLGDIVHAVGSKAQLERLTYIIGAPSSVDVKKIPGDIIAKRVVVTHREVLGKTLEELDFDDRYDVTITRTSRADVEIAATPGFRLQFGDVLLAVGNSESLKKLSSEVGDSVKKLDHPHIIPIFIGIALGVIVGSIPFTIPGIPAPVKLGLAGGPLLVAIILARIGQIGPLTWFMPRSSNLAIRELGITLFLACVGLNAGNAFIKTLVDGDGFYWMACAAAITILPLLLVGFIARLIYKINYVTICGLLAGSMTDPPALAFANQMTSGEAPSVAYATVYPLTMLMRVVSAQALVLIFWKM